jgi:DnaJ family protein A protein 2
MPQDLYSLLEIPRGADANEIRKAYLLMSRKYHPDKAAPEQREENEVKFKEIGRAYEVLSDEQKRSYYDQTGEIPGEGGNGGGGGGMPPGFNMGGGGMPFPFDIGGLFGMFGGGRGGPPAGPGVRSRRPGKAPARKTQIPLTFKDFYYGRTLQIHLERQRFCSGCKGEGATNVQACSGCQGSGITRRLIQMGPGMMMDASGPCTQCAGSGKTKGDACSGCKGSKFIKQDKSLELVITKGMKHGDVVTFPGESSQQEDWSEPGDVVVELVAADEDSGWERAGDNLQHRIGLTLGESLCGKNVRLDGHPGYPDGLFVHIPAGVVNRQEITVEGVGMPRSIGSGFGDAILVLTVLATKDERMLLETQKDVLQGIFKVGHGEVVPSTAQLKYAKPLVY